MIERSKLTVAESTLLIMAKVVLVLGIIASILVFFTVCITWEYSYLGTDIVGIDKVNWLDFPIFIYAVMATLVTWSLLSVIVEISVNVRCKKGNGNGDKWEKDFAIAVATDQKVKAKEILYGEIMRSNEFRKVLSGGKDVYHQQCIDTLNSKYAPYLKEIGEEHFKYTDRNDILDVFLSED